MPREEILIDPGFYTEQTDRGAKNRWRRGNRVRFRQGLPEKMGGWIQRTLGGEAIAGVPRGGVDWLALDRTKFTSVGTDRRLYLITSSNVVVNITPYRLATDEYGGTDTELTDPFDTTDTLTTVVVTHTSHGLSVGDTVYFANATAVGGITVDGEYQVTIVDTPNTYTIDTGIAASSTTNGGGTVDYAYEINVGRSLATAGVGFGTGTFGTGTFGTPRESGATALLFARTWSLDTWGEDLIANPRGGGIYTWDKSAGLVDNRATPIANAPALATAVVVSPTDRYMIAIGCVPIGGSELDGRVLRWCSQNDYTDWTPTRLNTSGQRRIDAGATMVSGLRTEQEILIFTDAPLYAMSSVAPPTVFNLRQVGSACGLIGSLARTAVGMNAFWMSQEDFYVYSGGQVSVLPCPVRNHVFEDVNRDAAATFHVGKNSLFQEVVFFYASAASQEIDRYVIFNYLEGSWYFGDLARTTWLDRDTSVRTVPAAFGSAGQMYDHESGFTDNGAAMGEYLESWDLEVPGAQGQSLGDNLALLRSIIPDTLRMSGDLSVTLKARKWPHGEQVTRGPFMLQPTTPFMPVRTRGRQISLRIESAQSSPTTDWRLGTWRANLRPHGRT